MNWSGKYSGELTEIAITAGGVSVAGGEGGAVMIGDGVTWREATPEEVAEMRAQPVGHCEQPTFADNCRAECEERGWRLLHVYEVARVGWELDNEAAIAVDGAGAHHVLSTNHGGFRVDDETLENVAEALAEHERWAAGLRRAVEIMEGPTGYAEGEGL